MKGNARTSRTTTTEWVIELETFSLPPSRAHVLLATVSQRKMTGIRRVIDDDEAVGEEQERETCEVTTR